MSAELGLRGWPPTVKVEPARPRLTPLVTQETDRYTEMWSSVSAYGTISPGEQVSPIFRQLASPPATVLDAGCGSGKGGLALAHAGYDVMLCDLTDAGLTEDARTLPFVQACLWKPLRAQVRRGQFDWVYCCDVLEHLPEQFTMLAVDQMLRIADRAVFLSVAFTDDHYGAWIGERLHQTVQPYVWWRDALRELGSVLDARDQLTRGIFVVAR